jgi:hypothetical protein
LLNYSLLIKPSDRRCGGGGDNRGFTFIVLLFSTNILSAFSGLLQQLLHKYKCERCCLKNPFL